MQPVDQFSLRHGRNTDAMFLGRSRQVSPDLRIVPLHRKTRHVRIEKEQTHERSRSSAGLVSRSLRKSSGSSVRSTRAQNSFHEFLGTRERIISPVLSSRRMNTSELSMRYRKGSLTAWLRPEKNSFAVSFVSCLTVCAIRPPSSKIMVLHTERYTNECTKFHIEYQAR